MGERGVVRAWGPGRHVAGNNLYSYYNDPEGNRIEWCAEVERPVAAARAALGEEAFAAAWAAGRALTIEQAVAEALAE